MHIKRFVLGDLSENCYIIEDEVNKVAVVVDPGEYDSRLCYYIDKSNIIIKYILLTHAHFDHVLGCCKLSEKYNAPIAMGEKESEIIIDLNKEFGNTSPLETLKPDILLNDGDVICFGDISIRVMATPGHTLGGVSYIVDGFVFSGDTLFNNSIGRTDFYSGDFEILCKSVKKLFALPDNTVVYPGHGLATKIGNEKVSNPYVKEI